MYRKHGHDLLPMIHFGPSTSTLSEGLLSELLQNRHLTH
jgi:hypothetical protein